MFLAAKQLGSEEAKCDLDAKKQRCEDAKRQSLLRFELFRKIKKILDLIKILVNNENILPRKELSALVPQYLSNFKLI